MVGPCSLYGLDRMGPVPLAIAMLLSVTALVALCAKHSSGRVKRSRAQPPAASTESGSEPNLPATPKSPRASPIPKQLLASVSNKGPIPGSRKKVTESESRVREEGNGKAVEGFGEGGVWQRSILMGEKCQPPEFSGAIYYDSRGNRLAEPPPRSPRASPFPGYFPADVEKVEPE